VRQRDVGDGRIQHLDQHRQHHRDGDERPLHRIELVLNSHRKIFSACRRRALRPSNSGPRSFRGAASR
jgi:hypothetical protein